MTNDLIIEIGGDISNFVKATKQAQQKFLDLQKGIEAKGINFKGSTKEFVKEMQQAEAKAKTVTKNIRNSISKEMFGGKTFSKITEEQQKEVARLADKYEKQMKKSDEAVAKSRIATKNIFMRCKLKMHKTCLKKLLKIIKKRKLFKKR